MSQDALTLVDVVSAAPGIRDARRRSQSVRAVAPADHRPARRRFAVQLVAAEPRHLDAAIALADRAYRRPLSSAEASELRELYRRLRGEEIPHDEAIRLVLARVLVSPAFLYRVEQPAPGDESRAGLRLGAGQPAELLPLVVDARRRAASGGRGRAAAPTATCWSPRRGGCARPADPPAGDRVRLPVAAHLRLRHPRRKERAAFPDVRRPERLRCTRRPFCFFTDLFQNDGSVLSVFDGDHTFLNKIWRSITSIPGVAGSRWRRVDGVRKYGRGGILALAATLAKQSGASRTSPILAR